MHRERRWPRANICRGCGGRIKRKRARLFMSARRTPLGGASLVGRISCAGRVFVAVAGTGVVEAGTGGVGVVVVDVVVSFEAASLRPRAEVSCVVVESLGGLRGREGEPSIRGVPNLPGCEAGLLANAERSSAVPWVPQSWSYS